MNIKKYIKPSDCQEMYAFEYFCFDMYFKEICRMSSKNKFVLSKNRKNLQTKYFRALY